MGTDSKGKHYQCRVSFHKYTVMKNICLPTSNKNSSLHCFADLLSSLISVELAILYDLFLSPCLPSGMS